jgi:iron-sulfur cluster repair protein YtfE (RIC family)
MEITKDITIEDLIETKPGAIDYLKEKGIRCIRCGEPIWGTLEEAAEEKGFDKEQIEGFVKDLNTMSQKGVDESATEKVKPGKLNT